MRIKNKSHNTDESLLWPFAETFVFNKSLVILLLIFRLFLQSFNQLFTKICCFFYKSQLFIKLMFL